MENKIPPPVIGIAVALLILLLNQMFSSWQLQSDILRVLALAIALIGLGIELFSVVLFFKAKTTVNPLKPQNAKSLVTNGLYQFSRNPMYLGMLMLLSGLVIWLGNVFTIPALFLFVFYINRFQIKPEEAALTTLFKEEYTSYMTRVRRWV